MSVHHHPIHTLDIQRRAVCDSRLLLGEGDLQGCPRSVARHIRAGTVQLQAERRPKRSRAALERKGKERMIALQRLNMSQEKVADVSTIDGAVTLCELAL